MLNSLNDVRDEYILSLVKPETTVFVQVCIDANFLNEKGQPNGIATLDENGKVPAEQLPDDIGGGGGGSLPEGFNPEDYVKFTDIASDTKVGVVKINDSLGIRIDSNGALYLDTASDSEIANQKGNTAIKVYQTPQAVKSGLTKHEKVEWTDEEKAKACETIGAATPKYVDDAIANASGSTSGISLEDWEFTLEDGTTVTKKVCVSETGNIGGIGGGGSGGLKLYKHSVRLTAFAPLIDSDMENIFSIDTTFQSTIKESLVGNMFETEEETILSKMIVNGEAYRLNGMQFESGDVGDSEYDSEYTVRNAAFSSGIGVVLICYNLSSMSEVYLLVTAVITDEVTEL